MLITGMDGACYLEGSQFVSESICNVLIPSCFDPMPLCDFPFVVTHDKSCDDTDIIKFPCVLVSFGNDGTGWPTDLQCSLNPLQWRVP